MSGLIERQHYTFGNDKFSLEDAYHDCKLVFDGITDGDSFQKADKGLILYYANEIIYALHEALQGVELVRCKDCKHWICHDRRCGYWNHGVKLLDWCCHAERRTDGCD